MWHKHVECTVCRWKRKWSYYVRFPKVDITNATFVCNKDTAVSGTQSVYNSVAWKNKYPNLNKDNKNVVIDNSVENDDVLNGPNFVDPNNGDYRIRPSFKLLDQGSNEKYQQNVGLAKYIKIKVIQNMTMLRCLPPKRT